MLNEQVGMILVVSGGYAKVNNDVRVRDFKHTAILRASGLQGQLCKCQAINLFDVQSIYIDAKHMDR